MTAAAPLSAGEIARRLTELPGWTGDEHAIEKTFTHTYHGNIHLLTYVAAKAQEITHHPDVDIRWQRITFRITTHDAIAKRHGATSTH